MNGMKNLRCALIGICWGMVFLVLQSGLHAQKPNIDWQQRKFSMFIHFGLYSQLGGVWNGKPVEWGYSEQIQSFAGIFSDWYAATAKTFNPEYWNADSIVQTARNAGMKSIVITAKHHDGFCLFHSRHTAFNIVDATPYKRDLVKELSQACEREGMAFGLYFSLIDWHYPQAFPISSHNADPVTPEHHRFNKKQVAELMTDYGKISEIWFDMGSLTTEQSKELYDLVDSLQPDCMISGRLGNNYCDFAVMADNAFPDRLLSMPWQTAASMFEETWGFRSWQKRGNPKDKIKEKIRSLVKVIGRGGNYLLNIGPDGEGKVIDFEKKVLLGIGQWLEKYGDAVYSTQGNPFAKPFEWGELTRKDRTLFLFIKEEYAHIPIVLQGVETLLTKARDLTAKKEIIVAQEETKLTIPPLPPNTVVHDEGGFRIIALQFEQKPIINDIPKQQWQKVLDKTNAIPLFGHSLTDYYGSYKSLTAYRWVIEDCPKNIRPSIEYSVGDRGRKIALRIGDTLLNYTLTEGTLIKKRQPEGISLDSVFIKQGRSVFGDIPEEKDGAHTDISLGEWQPWNNFEYGKRYEKPMRERSAIVVLQEITASQDGETAVEITAGNALYVLLNGKYVTADFPINRPKEQKVFILLPLKKGKNQLVVKCYNHRENVMPFAMEFPACWETCLRVFPEISQPETGTCDILLNRGDDRQPATPLGLPNLKIRLQ